VARPADLVEWGRKPAGFSHHSRIFFATVAAMPPAEEAVLAACGKRHRRWHAAARQSML